ncbi:MAG: aminoacyl-tRNA deacylase [Terriglobia bacterium]
MAVTERLKELLDQQGISYEVLRHDPAFTAQQLAASLHIPGRQFVKVVVVKLDGNPALAVMPAPLRINFKQLAAAAGAKKCSLASESEFQQLFPDCDLGAMPPFGRLYNLPTYAEETLAADREIVFNAGTHHEAIRMAYSDFARLSQARLAKFGEPPPAEITARKRAARVAARKRPARKRRVKRKAAKRKKAAPKRRGKKAKRRVAKRARRRKAARKRRKRKARAKRKPARRRARRRSRRRAKRRR